MMVNKYKAPCAVCGNVVNSNAGRLIKKDGRWQPIHLACKQGPQVKVIRFASGKEITRNAAGRCEDAPCCGCCTG